MLLDCMGAKGQKRALKQAFPSTRDSATILEYARRLRDGPDGKVPAAADVLIWFHARYLP